MPTNKQNFRSANWQNFHASDCIGFYYDAQRSSGDLSTGRTDTKKFRLDEYSCQSGAPRLPIVALTNSKPTKMANVRPAVSTADLTGTWRAIARGHDGELTTVDLLFDKGGWATLTISDTDDQRSNVQRVALEGDQLKLGGAGAGQSLGSLVEVTDRQMVIERDGGTITFVRALN